MKGCPSLKRKPSRLKEKKETNIFVVAAGHVVVERAFPGKGLAAVGHGACKWLLLLMRGANVRPQIGVAGKPLGAVGARKISTRRFARVLALVRPDLSHRTNQKKKNYSRPNPMAEQSQTCCGDLKVLLHRWQMRSTCTARWRSSSVHVLHTTVQPGSTHGYRLSCFCACARSRDCCMYARPQPSCVQLYHQKKPPQKTKNMKT